MWILRKNTFSTEHLRTTASEIYHSFDSIFIRLYPIFFLNQSGIIHIALKLVSGNKTNNNLKVAIRFGNLKTNYGQLFNIIGISSSTSNSWQDKLAFPTVLYKDCFIKPTIHSNWSPSPIPHHGALLRLICQVIKFST